MESCLRIGCGEGPKGAGVSSGETLIVARDRVTNQRTPPPTGERRHSGVWGLESQAEELGHEGSQSGRMGRVGCLGSRAWWEVELGHPTCPWSPLPGLLPHSSRTHVDAKGRWERWRYADLHSSRSGAAR